MRLIFTYLFFFVIASFGIFLFPVQRVHAQCAAGWEDCGENNCANGGRKCCTAGGAYGSDACTAPDRTCKSVPSCPSQQCCDWAGCDPIKTCSPGGSNACTGNDCVGASCNAGTCEYVCSPGPCGGNTPTPTATGAPMPPNCYNVKECPVASVGTSYPVDGWYYSWLGNLHGALNSDSGGTFAYYEAAPGTYGTGVGVSQRANWSGNYVARGTVGTDYYGCEAWEDAHTECRPPRFPASGVIYTCQGATAPAGSSAYYISSKTTEVQVDVRPVLPAPTMSHTCNTSNGSIDYTWTEVTGASHYTLRINLHEGTATEWVSPGDFYHDVVGGIGAGSPVVTQDTTNPDPYKQFTCTCNGVNCTCHFPQVHVGQDYDWWSVEPYYPGECYHLGGYSAGPFRCDCANQCNYTETNQASIDAYCDATVGGCNGAGQTWGSSLSCNAAGVYPCDWQPYNSAGTCTPPSCSGCTCLNPITIQARALSVPGVTSCDAGMFAASPSTGTLLPTATFTTEGVTRSIDGTNWASFTEPVSASSYTVTAGMPGAYVFSQTCMVKNGNTGSIATGSNPYAVSGFASNDTYQLVYLYTPAGPWWQVRGGDAYAAINASSSIPVFTPAQVFNLDATNPDGSAFADGLPGVVTYGSAGSYAFQLGSSGRTNVSSTNWLLQEDYNSQLRSTNFYTLFWRRFGAPTVTTPGFAGGGSTPASSTTPYFYDGDLTLGGWHLVSPASVVVIVNGNLTINGNIHVDEGAFVGFVVNGNIIVDSGVGNAKGTVLPANLEGVYITGTAGTFRSGTGNLKLVGRGIFVAGNFDLKREFASNDEAAEVFIYNPRLLIDMPDGFRDLPVRQEEVAP